MTLSGAELYRVVDAYASLGDHRTGDAGDLATAPWLAGELRALGATVDVRPVTFQRYVAEWEVRLDGEVVESLPLFYEGVGRLRAAPATVMVDPRPTPSGPTSTIELDGCAETANTARAAGREVVVFALEHPLGLLAAPNRRPRAARSFPVIQVAGRHRRQLGAASTVVDLDARIEPGRSANVVARFGTGPLSETVVVTTPISGWFRCGGERGTGIAVALALAEALAAQRPVLVLGATGHELATFGAELLDTEVEEAPRGVVHVGANAACAAGPPDGPAVATTATQGHLAAKLPLRFAGRDAEGVAVEAALAPSGWRVSRPRPATDPASWAGEASTWAPRGVTLLSVIDANPYFHTPQDVPEAVTSPAVLHDVAQALIAAASAALT